MNPSGTIEANYRRQPQRNVRVETPGLVRRGAHRSSRQTYVRWPERERRQAGFMLEECLIYLAVSSVLLGLAFGAFYRVMENAKGLRRNAADIARALQAGERWRDDIHRATGPLRLVSMEGAVEQAFHVPQKSGEVVYFFTGTNVVRRANPDAPWIETLAAVKHSRLLQDPREQVVAWRWELELNPGRKKPMVRPLFTFQAAAQIQETP